MIIEGVYGVLSLVAPRDFCIEWDAQNLEGISQYNGDHQSHEQALPRSMTSPSPSTDLDHVLLPVSELDDV